MVRFECLVRRSRGIDPIVVRSGQGLIDGTGPAERWQHLLDHLHPDDRRHFRPPRSLAGPARRRVRLRAGDEPYRSFQLAHRSRPAEPRGRIWEGILAEAGPEDAETRLATIADHLPAALYRCVVEGRSTRCTFVSPAVADVFGISAAAYREDPTRMLDNIHQDDRQEVIEAWYGAADQLRIFDCEFRIVLRRGQHWVRSVAQMTPGGRGVALADGIAMDITRRRLVQEQLERRNRELLTLCRISEIALNSPSVASGLEQMAREISRHMNFPTAVIAIYDEAAQVVTVRGRHNVPHLPRGGPPRLPIRQTLAWEVIRTGRPLIENDALDHQEERFEFMRRAGHRTFVGVPIKIGERVIGCLGLGHPDHLDPPPAVVELLSSWADSIASFIAGKGQEELVPPRRPNLRSLEFEAAFASRLTARQREVLAILKSGRSNRSIAEQLGLQEATVKIHVRAILKALGVRNRTQAAMIANSVEGGMRPGRGARRRRGGRMSDGR